MTRYDKLVRDKIPEIVRARGGQPKTHIAGQAEYWLKLKAKLGEEVAEFAASEAIEELADIWEVIDAIIEHKKFTTAEVAAAKAQKLAERGGFKRRIILEES